jgi:hypothetical protein
VANMTSPPLTCFNKQSRSTIGVRAGTFATLAYSISSMASELVLPLSGFDHGRSELLMPGSYSMGLIYVSFLFFAAWRSDGRQKVHS